MTVIKKYRSYSGIVSNFVTLFRIICPQYTLERHCSAKLKEKAYRNVYVSFFTPFTDSVRLMHPESEFIQYEDGVGSYCIDDLENRFRSGIFKRINRFFMGGRLSYNIKKMYLNHPECYGGDMFETLEAIPKFNNVSDLEKIFDYKENDLYKKNKFIYLTQPLTETKIGEDAATIEKAILNTVNNSVLLRVHPRQKSENYSDFNIDYVRNLWELECAKQINDSHILIGAFSTAQFTPKMLFDKEPTVIFTYKLYGDFFENTEKTIEKLRLMYKNIGKIIVVENLEELKHLLAEFGDNKGNEQQ